jgi:alpha-tubulin suppressor-like RCC1 family protein
VRILAVILLCSLASTVEAASRLRIEEGARSRQTRLSSSGDAYHACVVLADGTVRCWGANLAGQLGDGTTSPTRTSPVQVSGLTNIVSVATGGGHTCALHALGGVFCWGYGVNGQLGAGNGNSSSTPVQVTGLDNVTAIAAGEYFTCALRVDGTVWCWGSDSDGQLGDGHGGGDSNISAYAPVKAQIKSPAVAITAGGAHACAIELDPTSGSIAQCWGSDFSGELGDGTGVSGDKVLPVNVIGLTGVVDISAGASHTCALLSDSTLRCWGENFHGQVGNGSTSPAVYTPTTVLVSIFSSPLFGGIALSGVVAVSAGGLHSCAILADGSARCWGDDTVGQLGDSNTNTQRSLANIAVVGLNDTFEIVTGAYNTCALEVVNFTARCWGDNGDGQLGNGTTNPTSVPNLVNGIPGSTGIGGRYIRASYRWSCASRGNGSVACWGGPGNNSVGPNPVTMPVGGNAVTMTAGFSSTCAVQFQGQASCFSNNSFTLGNTYGPQLVGFAQGNRHVCLLLVGGTVSCVGDNNRGQLGNPAGGVPEVLVPVVDASLNPLHGIVTISAGAFHTCVVNVDGKVYCWGDNSSGQLGLGTIGGFKNFASPVIGLNSIVSVSSNLDAAIGGLGLASFSCGVSALGGASCWGYGATGQLGNGNIQTQPIAQSVFGLTNVAGLAAGGSHACAVLADGSAKCWGDDSRDQLGAADTAIHNTPVPVIQNFSTKNGLTFALNLVDVTAIAAGVSHTCSLQATGLPRCWGDNTAGEIGGGTISSQPQPRPTIVNSFTANVDPAVSLRPSDRVAIVTALVNCPVGGEAHLSLTLEQAQTTGGGNAVTSCAGGLVQVPFTVAAHGPQEFQAGPATAIVEALVKDGGSVTEDQHWTRDVVLTVSQ